jgi:5-methylcytosine-specific restriction protein B
MIHPHDVERWRAKLDQVKAAADADGEVQANWAERDELRPARDAEARQLVADLVATRDLAAFKSGADSWSRRPGPYKAFRGFGQMWLNQVANNLPADSTDVDVLVTAFTTPPSTEEARERFDAVERVTRDLASKGRPAVGMIPYVLSMFWGTDNAGAQWPIIWKSTADRMNDLGWVRSWSNADRYLVLVEASRTFFAGERHTFERLMWFLTERRRFVGINPALPDMCVEAAALMESFHVGGGYPDEAATDRAASLAAQLRGELLLAGQGLCTELGQIAGRELESRPLQLKTSFDKDAPFRADTYAVWRQPGETWAPGFRLWATRSGVAFGVHGGWGNGTPEDVAEKAERAKSALPNGYRWIGIKPHKTGDRLIPLDDGPSGELFAGTWWEWDGLPPGIELASEVLRNAEALKPVLQVMSEETSTGDQATPANSDELKAALSRFKQERPYPNEKDQWNKEERVQFADDLSAENLSVFDLDRFRLLVNAKRYGNPGPQSVLNASLGAMDSLELDAFAGKLREILWGEGEVASRIDRGLDHDDLGTKGLGESVLLKLFAITDPSRFLPTFPLTGPVGKIAMLRRLGLPLPDASLSRGEQHVEANDTLRRALEPLLPGDPWGQGQFAFWLLREEETSTDTEEDRIAQAAEQLLLPESFLREIEELLLEKGQLIFYGPPGTGKTYLADKFAAALQPDPERRMIVQFHPSMSYEDFFEGYRPRTNDKGELSYELRPGPLAMMAAKAEDAPGTPHVMIIDEINRANLPRVFGELLFLLEYRNKSVRTAYRPDEPFELPKNLFFIGTMNTADRSIAMVDAALRRRFHFVPFMPHEGAMKSLLHEWLSKHGEPAWVATLVDKVNDQLRILLKGPHLQVGHSHFMVKTSADKTALTAERLERIWRYNIYPSIEDQLYGRPDQLAQFTWEHVHEAYGPSSKSGIAATETSVAESEASVVEGAEGGSV